MSSPPVSDGEESRSPPVLVNESGAESPDEAAVEDVAMPVLEPEVNPEAEVDPMAALKTRDLQTIFRLWGETHSAAGFDPVFILTR